MPKHFEGYQKARDAVEQMDEGELVAYIDSLFGRDNLRYGATLAEVRAEALRQCDQEWTDTSSQEYQDAQFWQSLVASGRKAWGLP